MRRIYFFSCIILVISVLFTGCKKKDKPVDVTKPKLTEEQVEVSKNVEINILRYEQDLFNIDQGNMKAAFAALYGKYPENLIAKNAWNNNEMLRPSRRRRGSL